ncbi:hypothetical protein H8R02_11765 [Ramlibacter sp. GTP1]|uniref:Cyclophilin-like domain-containing protein n=1 Tax=Ramlibacter albus TaxID=2079448 RepID=A0A923M919_9BURK|nr:hypothetical protein [Ramlibacter albus]
MKIVIEIDGKPIAATLDDTTMGREFAAMLPLTLTLTDYGNMEKVAELPRKLAPRDAPRGADPDIGDIAYYPAWGKVRIFYKDLGYLDGLVKLGSIDASIAPLQVPGPLRVVIKRLEPAR